MASPRHPESSDPRKSADQQRDGGLASSVAAQIILLVDPSPATQQALAEVLRESGYGVLCADGLRATERVCEVLTEPPSLALLEFRLRDGRADMLANSLRAHWPGLFIVYFSGSHPSYDEALRAALLAPGTALLAKPTSLDVVVETVRARAE